MDCDAICYHEDERTYEDDEILISDLSLEELYEVTNRNLAGIEWYANKLREPLLKKHGFPPLAKEATKEDIFTYYALNNILEYVDRISMIVKNEKRLLEEEL